MDKEKNTKNMKAIFARLKKMYECENHFISKEYFNPDFRVMEVLGLVKYQKEEGYSHPIFHDEWSDPDEWAGYSYQFTEKGKVMLNEHYEKEKAKKAYTRTRGPMRRALRAALDSTLEKQVERLAMAVKGDLCTGNNKGAAELLQAAGLVRYVDDQGSMFSSDYRFEATEKGKKLYEQFLKEAKK